MVLEKIVWGERKIFLYVVNYGTLDVREVGRNKRSLRKLPVITRETVAEISSRMYPVFFKSVEEIDFEGVGAVVLVHQIVNGEHITTGPYSLIDG